MEPQSNRRIVITGATGLIGKKLIDRLALLGNHTIAFVRNPERDRVRVPNASEYVSWNAMQAEGAWGASIEGVDAVINLAGAPIAQKWTPEWKDSIRDSRVLGTRHLVQAIANSEKKPSVLINGSAVGYYGSSAYQAVDESSPAGDDFMAEVCSAWEAEAFKGEEHGLRVATVRTGIVLSPDGGALAKMILPFRMFVGGPFGSGEQPWPWIHIDDVLDIILFILDNPEISGPVIGSAPEQISNADFCQTLGRVLHRPSLFHVPKFILRLILGEGAVTVLSGQRVIPQKLMKSGYNFRWNSAQEALSDLLTKKK